jgi:hypothetical protein
MSRHGRYHQHGDHFLRRRLQRRLEATQRAMDRARRKYETAREHHVQALQELDRLRQLPPYPHHTREEAP